MDFDTNYHALTRETSLTRPESAINLWMFGTMSVSKMIEVYSPLELMNSPTVDSWPDFFFLKKKKLGMHFLLQKSF